MIMTRPTLGAVTSVVLLLLIAVTVGSDATEESGFVPLLDGKTLAGWEGDTKFWSVEDGAITGRTTKDNPSRTGTFLLWAGGEVADFELRLKARIVGGNSGIGYRGTHVDGFQVAGYQCDFGPGQSHNGKLYEDGTKDDPGRAGLAYPGQKVIVRRNRRREVIATFGDAEALKRGIAEGEWHHVTIVARGNHVVHRINGDTMIEAFDEDPERRRASGILSLQIHNGDPMLVQFKDIRLKVLKPAPAD